MELNFSELNNKNTKNPYDNFDYNAYETQTGPNPEKYWEKSNAQNQQKAKKKKVSFDDILSNMNLVVNKSGVLQYMQIASKDEQQEQYHQQDYSQQQQYQQQEQYQQQQQYYPQQQIHVQKTQQEPLDPSVKHSYIFNKYFKDYQDAQPSAPKVRVPKTMQEYRQMLIEDKIKHIQQQKKIAEIKSTKLLFVSNPGNQNNPNNPRNMQSSKNNLRSMNFR
jgi:hypothetical protein